MNEPLYLGIINLFLSILCLKNNRFSITLNYFFMLPSCCCFPHESHRSLFRIQCFQGNLESYDIGQDYSISVRLITCKVHAEPWSCYEVWGGWISIINLIILTLNLTAGGWIWCLCWAFICMWSCVSKQGWVLLLCGEKTQKCERSGQLRTYWPLWMRRSERSGGCDLSASCCSVRSHFWWQACTTASQSDWQFNHPLYKDSGRNSFRTDPFLIWYLRK